jgi:hypothetical protein
VGRAAGIGLAVLLLAGVGWLLLVHLPHRREVQALRTLVERGRVATAAGDAAGLAALLADPVRVQIEDAGSESLRRDAVQKGLSRGLRRTTFSDIEVRREAIEVETGAPRAQIELTVRATVKDQDLHAQAPRSFHVRLSAARASREATWTIDAVELREPRVSPAGGASAR